MKTKVFKISIDGIEHMVEVEQLEAVKSYDVAVSAEPIAASQPAESFERVKVNKKPILTVPFTCTKM